MESISLRLISVILFVFTSALFLTPVVPSIPTAKASLNRVLISTHETTLAEATVKTNQPRSVSIRQYLADIFGAPGFKTSWYDNIIDTQVTGDTATVKTNLSRGDKKITYIRGVVSSNPQYRFH